MSWSYSCPKCEGALSPDRSVMLCGARGDGRKVLIGFHPQPGNYEIYLPPETEITKGDRWSFYCPICGESLAYEEDENLCALNLTSDGKQRQVFFSRIAGEKVTFVVTNRKVEERHGKDSETYVHQLMSLKYFF